MLALREIFGVGPVPHATILAEPGGASRFGSSRQVVYVAGLDRVVRDSADTSDVDTWPGKERLACGVRWSRPPSTPVGRTAPITNSTRARRLEPEPLTVAPKIAKRPFHVLGELEVQTT
jgi:hypothetical protein